jgi:DNA-binding Lrp family transcriptional regulator
VYHRFKADIISPELAKQLNVTTRTIEREIKKLKEIGIIKRIGARRGKDWHRK